MKKGVVKFKLLGIVLFLFLILNLGNVSSFWCYQESANISNQKGTDGNCGQVYNGSYLFTGPWNSPELLIDGNWNTDGWGAAGGSSLYINYTKPLGALNTSLWQLKELAVSSDATYFTNLSISSCFNYYNNTLALRWDSYYQSGGDSVYCYNGAWNYLTTFPGLDPTFQTYPYEEAMVWNITDSMIFNCTQLTRPGLNYSLVNDIHNDQITNNCLNIFAANITLDCQGHRIYSIQNYSGIYSNSTNSTIKNCNITMGSWASTSGIYLNSSNHSTVFNNSISGQNYGGIFLHSSSNDTLTSNTVTNTYGEGIYLEYSSNNTLISNTGIGTIWEGIFIDYYSNNNILTSNTGISNSGFGGIVLGVSSNNNILTSNTGISNSSMGIYLSDAPNNTLINNTGISNSGGGITIAYTSNNNTLINNTGISNSGTGIYLLTYPTKNILISNIGMSNSYIGILLSPSPNNTLISDIGISNLSAGILLYVSPGNNLTNCVSSNNVYGLYISDSNGTIVTNLTAKNNSAYGIFLQGDAGNNIIKNSFIQLNNGSAFSFNNSVISPKNNSIYNNYFNSSVAFSNLSASSKNYFNTTKTTGTNIVGGNFLAGNYWAAPNGTGFSQTCTDGGNGICTTSYNLDGINFDYLPLVCHENWTCDTSFGACVNGIQIKVCRDLNFCQTYQFKPVEATQTCGGSVDLGGHTVPSQGGGGGATTFTQSIENITSVQPVEITINNSRMDLSSLTINVKNSVSDTSVNITTINQTESGLPIGKLYQAFEINPGIENSNIINATINFKINKTWLSENNITFHSKGNRSWLVENDIVGNVILYRNPKGVKAWFPLTTNFFSEDNQYYYFSAYSPGFSTFAIFLNRYDCLPNSARCDNNEVQLCVGNSTWLVTDHCSDTCDNGKCTSSFFKSNQFYFLIIIGIIAILVIGIIIFIYKKRKEKRKIRKEIRRNKRLKRKSRR